MCDCGTGVADCACECVCVDVCPSPLAVNAREVKLDGHCNGTVVAVWGTRKVGRSVTKCIPSIEVLGETIEPKPRVRSSSLPFSRREKYLWVVVPSPCGKDVVCRFIVHHHNVPCLCFPHECRVLLFCFCTLAPALCRVVTRLRCVHTYAHHFTPPSYSPLTFCFSFVFPDFTIIAAAGERVRVCVCESRVAAAAFAVGHCSWPTPFSTLCSPSHKLASPRSVSEKDPRNSANEESEAKDKRTQRSRRTPTKNKNVEAVL
ncbi:hypothetical protein LINJ_34_2330 [Leishmania infantum JPCM5]|uniref:Uncharacterized protein n=4 Tax=Leishmania donovani species complex TaxID=38574 RepID=A4IA27_LEIIN|nr:hypothetical protein LINJ_34_2330 [Leishmania infantum JPCM5]XP_003864392.1 hypothetical protein LDBPK_342330 [Leishmania donovani]CAM71683.1 hypothetical protein LINJ_34_2330 [Leishmania infantum JPCM5]CBZ37710.1 hypothetical protein LDBPK_342330 [Leishmania donovani]|eukprot:XP_001468596.1 hypothetical protein LINJ_34_2330 [Leishmania infantum JPCM5]